MEPRQETQSVLVLAKRQCGGWRLGSRDYRRAFAVAYAGAPRRRRRCHQAACWHGRRQRRPPKAPACRPSTLKTPQTRFSAPNPAGRRHNELRIVGEERLRAPNGREQQEGADGWHPCGWNPSE